jgi:hypothetical protein
LQTEFRSENGVGREVGGIGVLAGRGDCPGRLVAQKPARVVKNGYGDRLPSLYHCTAPFLHGDSVLERVAWIRKRDGIFRPRCLQFGYSSRSTSDTLQDAASDFHVTVLHRLVVFCGSIRCTDAVLVLLLAVIAYVLCVLRNRKSLRY